MKKSNIENDNYIDTLTKNELVTLLDNFHIAYKKNAQKESLVIIIKDNLNKIINNIFKLFQYDEYLCLKLVIKKNGKIKTKVNEYLINFLNNLEKIHLVKKQDEEYIMPREILNEFKKISNDKKNIKLVKTNTEKYNTILGFIDTYGAVDFDYFYQIYSEKYSDNKEDTLEMIISLSKFYNEFKTFNNKNKIYIASNEFRTFNDLNKHIDLNADYHNYTLNEIVSIHNFDFMSKKRSYKKLSKYINKNYYIEKGGFTIFKRLVLGPYISVWNMQNNKSIKNFNNKLSTLFEFKNDKQKAKFMKLINDVANDFPKWNIKNKEEEVKDVKKES